MNTNLTLDSLSQTSTKQTCLKVLSAQTTTVNNICMITDVFKRNGRIYIDKLQNLENLSSENEYRVFEFMEAITSETWNI